MRLRGREYRIRTACMLPVLTLSVSIAAASTAPAAAFAQDDVRSLDVGSAEVRFPTPSRHAIVAQQPGAVRALYGCGDVIPYPREPGRVLRVVRVEPNHLMVREGASGRPQVLRTGDAAPGFPGRIFSGTVLIDAVHYRYRRVERVVHVDPVLVTLEGSRAVLEVEVARRAGSTPLILSEGTDGSSAGPSLPKRTTLDATLLTQARVRELASDRYEVQAADVQAVLENAGRVLAELGPGVLPTYSTTGGVQYRITSAASDGVLGRQGFTVTAPKLAERAGIEVGDTILSVNGVPVDGFGSLYQIYQQVRRNRATATVQVELERRGNRLTKTYRVR